MLLVAVSKGQSVDAIKALYNKGQRDFGESRIQEVEEKRKHLPQDIKWHLIGTLQKKKVPKVIGKFVLIHSVDSIELAEKLSQASLKQNLVQDILLQVNASGEATKHGFTLDELQQAFADLLKFPGIRLKGLMTMAPHTDDEEVIRDTFCKTRKLQRLLKEQYNLNDFNELSMGMSSDYKIAIECGATLVRIGTLLFPT